MITLLGPLLLLAVYMALVACLASRFRGLSLWTQATGIAAAVRLGLLCSSPSTAGRPRTLGDAVSPFLLLLPRARHSHRDWGWMALVTAAVLLGDAPAAANDLCFLDTLGFPPLIA